jgi:hypothetical protein
VRVAHREVLDVAVDLRKKLTHHLANGKACVFQQRTNASYRYQLILPMVFWIPSTKYGLEKISEFKKDSAPQCAYQPSRAA